MKFYNPFKWHIVQHKNGKYAVRKFTLFFIFLDKDLKYKWADDYYVNRWCMHETIDQAKLTLSNYYINRKLKKWTKV